MINLMNDYKAYYKGLQIGLVIGLVLGALVTVGIMLAIPNKPAKTELSPQNNHVPEYNKDYIAGFKDGVFRTIQAGRDK